MKFLLSGMILSTLLSQAAFARYVGPRLIKDSRSGFTLPEFSKTELCEIYTDKVVITRVQGEKSEVKTIETKTVQLEADTFGLVAELKKAPLIDSAGPVDGPSNFYIGIELQPNDSTRNVTIYAENGYTGQIQERDNSKARLLRDVMDNLCR